VLHLLLEHSIRDHIKKHRLNIYKQYAATLCSFLALIAISIISFADQFIGLIYLLISAILLLLTMAVFYKKRRVYYYTLLLDGIMILQFIFVYATKWLQQEF
jgi:hypothetical protein